MDSAHPTPLSFVAPGLRFDEGVVRGPLDGLDRLCVDAPPVVTDRGVREPGVLAEVGTAEVPRPYDGVGLPSSLSRSTSSGTTPTASSRRRSSGSDAR